MAACTLAAIYLHFFTAIFRHFQNAIDKRWSGKGENLLQVLRYGQLYGGSNYDELNDLYGKYVRNTSHSLLGDHRSYFSLSDATALSPNDFNKHQHFLVVTNGVDQGTVEAIIYWKSNGLNIDAIVYWVFEINGEPFIEFSIYSPTESLVEYETHAYVLNTNNNNNPTKEAEMLKDQKAAAYWPGWREKIKKLQKGDIVFLYRSGTGIIAYGKADGKLRICECDGHPDYEYNMHLDDFCILTEPISAARLKEITKQGHNFRQTMFSLSEEATQALCKVINANRKNMKLH